MRNMMPIFYLVSVLFFSCGNHLDENELNGNWAVVEFKANTPEISPSLIEAAKVEALSTRYSFQKDKRFSMKSNYYSKGEHGNYEFIPKTNRIKMIYSSEEDNSTEEYKIEILNRNSMKWKQDLVELGSLTMTFKKE